ncbi:type II toxin-antitoxin system RelE/ParE family toxin [Anaerosoma tenue]|uniref:type II toxin-antitoxin system RelE/ParE family toxin n=1 Tax=Anaerosoma tenue TaxID=2933588 RepID=UPI002260AF17|nr:type II toxin-antitoxin system RelE/ParE family toxin [Anaerosoma tenue]MCK8114808.1 type II toxin-antitoxin system RelE/ParE family toxin [Anaerosoma tenue]
MPRRSLRVVLTRAAADDLDEAFAYVAERNRQAALDTLTRVETAVRTLGEFPDMGAPLSSEEYGLLPAGIRFVVVEPYAIFYRASADTVTVLRILHLRRDFLGEMLG